MLSRCSRPPRVPPACILCDSSCPWAPAPHRASAGRGRPPRRRGRSQTIPSRNMRSPPPHQRRNGAQTMPSRRVARYSGGPPVTAMRPNTTRPSSACSTRPATEIWALFRYILCSAIRRAGTPTSSAQVDARRSRANAVASKSPARRPPAAGPPPWEDLRRHFGDATCGRHRRLPAQSPKAPGPRLRRDLRLAFGVADISGNRKLPPVHR